MSSRQGSPSPEPITLREERLSLRSVRDRLNSLLALRLDLFRKRQVWLPTWRGWLCLLLGLSALAWTAVRRAHTFLAVTRPVPADVLVVEGWVSDSIVRAAADEFRTNYYRYVVATGCPIPKGHILYGDRTYASVAAKSLVKLGIPPSQVIEAPPKETFRHRTLEAARAAKRKLDGLGIRPLGINVTTCGPHARRTWITYRRVFGPQVPVGVIARPSEEFDPDRWWASSEGMKETLTEGFGWFYEALFAPAP